MTFQSQSLGRQQETKRTNDQDGITDSATMQERSAGIESALKDHATDNTSYFNSDSG